MVYRRAMRVVGLGALHKRVGRFVCEMSIYLSTSERFYATVFSYPQLTHQALNQLMMGYIYIFIP
jgi:hypothetical protein